MVSAMAGRSKMVYGFIEGRNRSRIQGKGMSQFANRGLMWRVCRGKKTRELCLHIYYTAVFVPLLLFDGFLLTRGRSDRTHISVGLAILRH